MFFTIITDDIIFLSALVAEIIEVKDQKEKPLRVKKKLEKSQLCIEHLSKTSLTSLQYDIPLSPLKRQKRDFLFFVYKNFPIYSRV